MANPNKHYHGHETNFSLMIDGKTGLFMAMDQADQGSGDNLMVVHNQQPTKMDNRLVTINALPDDVLYLIFAFHRRIFAPGYPSPITIWKWHRFAHVCRRWRRVIFASPRHLKLGLVITGGRHRTTFDSGCWPPLPIYIWTQTDSADDLTSPDVVAALKHSDRIHKISIKVSTWMFIKSTSWVENSFPALERLSLASESHLDTIVLPTGFLMGGSDGPPRRLRSISLRNVCFPHWLIQSSRDLVSLNFDLIRFDRASSPSVKALVAALSETHRLESLCVNPDIFRPRYPDQRSTRRSSITKNRVVLRALATFDFDGPSGYLEKLVSRIDAPILRHLKVSFSQRVFDLPQLSQFVSRMKNMNSLPHGLSIGFYDEGLFIKHCFRHSDSPPPRKTSFSLELSIKGRRAARDWTASQVLHICGQLSPFTSSVERLWIAIRLTSDGEEGTERWLQLLGAFRGVRDLHLFCWYWHRDPALCMERALEESTKRETAQELFPVLRVIQMNETRRQAWDNHGIAAFVDARRSTGRPLVVCGGPGSVQKPED